MKVINKIILIPVLGLFGLYKGHAAEDPAARKDILDCDDATITSAGGFSMSDDTQIVFKIIRKNSAAAAAPAAAPAVTAAPAAQSATVKNAQYK